MSWLFSQALAAEYLGENCLDGEPSAPSSGNLTPQAYLSPDRTMVFSRLSRFGMTFKPLTDDLGAELLTLYLEDFRAKTSVQQEKAQALTASAAECGEKWRGSFAKYDPNSCSWKTHQCSLLGGLDEFSGTWPQWGLMRGGACWEQPMLAHRTSVTASGLWLTPRASDISKGESNHTFLKRMGDRTERCAQSLAAQVNNPKTWPTPRSCSAMGAMITPESAWKENRFPNLETIVWRRIWTTPTAHNAKETNAPSESIRNTPTLAAQAGGHLNPMWVEWLMGWPLGYTDLKPLETDKCHCVQPQHGESCQISEAA